MPRDATKTRNCKTTDDRGQDRIDLILLGRRHHTLVCQKVGAAHVLDSILLFIAPRFQSAAQRQSISSLLRLLADHLSGKGHVLL